jgi:hypothetical protein
MSILKKISVSIKHFLLFSIFFMTVQDLFSQTSLGQQLFSSAIENLFNSNKLEIVKSIIISIALPLLTFLGFQKFYLEPRFQARNSRRRYATALFIACDELRMHLAETLNLVNLNDSSTIEAMKKIPDNDFKDNTAWFTKSGYYTTITAYKIAVVSGWLKIYQNSLLFFSYQASRAFLNDLYKHSQNLKLAFSTETCLWYYYFDAIGERVIEVETTVTPVISFAKFCDCYTNDKNFRLFFEQLHMYIWFIGDKDPKYLGTIPKILKSLKELTNFLDKKNLLSGFDVKRPETALGELEKARTKGWNKNDPS